MINSHTVRIRWTIDTEGCFLNNSNRHPAHPQGHQLSTELSKVISKANSNFVHVARLIDVDIQVATAFTYHQTVFQTLSFSVTSLMNPNWSAIVNGFHTVEDLPCSVCDHSRDEYFSMKQGLICSMLTCAWSGIKMNWGGVLIEICEVRLLLMHLFLQFGP